MNPSTGEPWQAAEIADFDTQTDWGVGVSWSTHEVDAFRCYQMFVTVSHVTENRVASGTLSPVTGWQSISLTSPAAADTWSLTSGTEYALVLSTTDDGSAVMRALDSGDDHPLGYLSTSVGFGSDGSPSTVGADDTAVAGFAVTDSDGLFLFGNPYTSLTEYEVHSAQTLTQTVTLPDTSSRGWVQVVARQASTATTASLVAKLFRSSDDTQIGGDVTVTPFDVRDNPRQAQIIALPAASAAAGTAVDHYIELTCTASEGAGWLTPGLVPEYADTTSTELLTTNQQGLETNTAGWAPGTSSTAARSTSQAYAGSASLALTSSSGTGTRSVHTDAPAFAVLVGATYTASAQVRGTVARTSRLKLIWYDSGTSEISRDAGTDVVDSTTAWTELTVTAIAPATAVTAALLWEVDALPTAETHYGDAFTVSETITMASLTFTGAATVAGSAIDGAFPVLVGTSETSPSGQGAA